MSKSQQHTTTCKPKRVMRLLCRNNYGKIANVQQDKPLDQRGGDTESPPGQPDQPFSNGFEGLPLDQGGGDTESPPGQPDQPLPDVLGSSKDFVLEEDRSDATHNERGPDFP